MTQYYFAYGMNTNNDSMRHRSPASTSLGRAQLRNYQFRFAYHADVVPDIGNVVDGVLWTVDRAGLVALDVLEGYPRYYDRKKVTIECQGDLYRAWVYVMTPGNPLCMPSQHYREMLFEGYRQHAVPVNQLIDGLERAGRYEIDHYDQMSYN